MLAHMHLWNPLRVRLEFFGFYRRMALRLSCALEFNPFRIASFCPARFGVLLGLLLEPLKGGELELAIRFANNAGSATGSAGILAGEWILKMLLAGKDAGAPSDAPSDAPSGILFITKEQPDAASHCFF